MRLAETLSFLVLLSSVGLAEDIWVPDDHSTIQAAIQAAGNGDTINVRSGTYVENIDFLGKAITVQSESGAPSTIIDGNQAGSVVTIASGEGRDSILRGFTLTNGSGTPVSSAWLGGGIYCVGSPIIEHNSITGNKRVYYLTPGSGGGIYVDGTPIIRSNWITHNAAFGGNGGGICCAADSAPSIVANTITDNWFDDGGMAVAPDLGGGVYCGPGATPLVLGNPFYHNAALKRGGAICGAATAAPVIRDNWIQGNSTLHFLQSPRGAGIYVDGPATIDTNTVIFGSMVLSDRYANTGFGMGVGIYATSATITNNQIYGNQAGGTSMPAGYCHGAGLYCVSCTVRANAVHGNAALGAPTFSVPRGAGIYAVDSTLERNVVFANVVSDGEVAGAGIFARSSILRGNTVAGNEGRDLAGWGGSIPRGGGIFAEASTIENNLVHGNWVEADGRGGGIYVEGSSPLAFANNTVVDNRAGRGGGVYCDACPSLDIVNTILFGNVASTGAQLEVGSSFSPSTVEVSYSDFEGGQAQVYVEVGCTLTWGAGMLDADPLFVTQGYSYFMLSRTVTGHAVDSPCWNSGDPLSPIPPGTTQTDLMPDTEIVDMGFHYGLPAAAATMRVRGSNPVSYFASQPVLGDVFRARVHVASTTGHTLAWLVGYGTPTTVILGGGQALLVDVSDPDGELLRLPIVPGPIANYDLPVPPDVLFAGFTASTQALHFGGVQPFALSNAQDLTLGY